MALLRRRPRQRLDLPEVAELPETTLSVVKDDSSFVAEDGGTIHSLGYMLLDPTRNLTQVGDDAWLRTIGCRLTKIAGLTHHPEAAQEAGFAPGSVAVLAPVPDNPVDANAVGVWDATGEHQIGFVPAEHAKEIAARIAAGEALGALIMREYRRESKTGPRLGLVMLIAPVARIKLRVEGYTEPIAPADE
jgi:hypothetical protein